MFVVFIAVIVVLLVIVSLMSTGGTSGSGGVDQTKAVKAVSELSNLAQSAGFYKTMTAESNYAGINNDELVNAGIVSADDIVVVAGTATDDPATGVVIDADGVALADGTKMVKSKAVSGLYYIVAENADTNKFDMTVAIDPNLTSELKKALEKAYAKLNATATAAVDTDGANDTGATDDGATLITFN